MEGNLAVCTKVACVSAFESKSLQLTPAVLTHVSHLLLRDPERGPECEDAALWLLEPLQVSKAPRYPHIDRQAHQGPPLQRKCATIASLNVQEHDVGICGRPARHFSC